MPVEIPLQVDMFSGKLVDSRNSAQRVRDRERNRPQQTEMFSQRDIAQFGVKAHPQMPLIEHTTLVLICEDPRTPEEIERDRQKAAEALTTPLFAVQEQVQVEEVPQCELHPRIDPLPPLVVGLRFKQRFVQAHVRRRHHIENAGQIYSRSGEL